MHHSPPFQDNPASLADETTSTSLTLLERIKTHDGDAWRRLVALYTPLLRYWFRRWGVASDDVDDLMQEVYQAVAHSLNGFRRESEHDSFRAWLRGIARNKALILFRNQGSIRGLGGTDFYRRSLLIPDRGDSLIPDEAEAQVVNSLYQSALSQIRGEFEGRTWQAFWRMTVEGQASAAIAEDLGMTAAAVRQAKSRVLRRLKDLLGELPKL